MAPLQNRTKGFISLLLSAAILGSFGLWVRILNNDLSAYQQIFFRNSVAFLIAVAILAITRRKISIATIPRKYFFFYAISFPISVIFYTLAILKTTIPVAVFTLYIGSIVASFIIGKLVFHEKFHRNKVFGVILVLAGLVFLTMPFSVNSLNAGIILGLLSGITESIANAFRKYLGDKADRYFLVSLSMLGGILISTVMMLFSHQSLNFGMNISPIGWVVGILFGALILLMSYFSIVGFQYFDLNLGTVVRSSELVFATVFAALFFYEYPSMNVIIGGLLVVVAIVISNSEMIHKKTRTSLKKKRKTTISISY